MGLLGRRPSSLVRNAGRACGCNLAPREGAHSLVGLPDTCYEFWDYPGGELVFFSGLHPGCSTRRKSQRNDSLVGRIFPWLQGIFVGLLRADTGPMGGF